MQKHFFSLILTLIGIMTFSGCQWFKSNTPCTSCASHHHHKTNQPDLVRHIKSKASFDELIATAKLPVVVKFGARWCSACQEMKPILAEIARSKQDQYIIADVELTEAKELQAEFNIKGVPAIYIFKNGKEVPVTHHPTGFIAKEQLLVFLGKQLDHHI